MTLCGAQWSGFGPTDMPRIAIVAAMEREVAPLVRNWKVSSIENSGRQYKVFEDGEVSLICAGIGAEAARRATEAIIQQTRASHILSAGFGGALDPSLRVGEIFEPRTVINSADGSRTDTGRGQGTLVSVGMVAGHEQKERLRDAYSATVVDMEAAAVAQGAELRGATFGALKAISDEAGFAMPPMEKFVGVDGSFASARFAFHVTVRPWLWRATIALARNSAKASQALCAAIEGYLRARAAEGIAHS